MNEWQKRRFAQMTAEHAKLGGGIVAVLGLAFKKNTNDFRESPAIDVCNHLLAAGVGLRLQDERVDATAFRSTLVDEMGIGVSFFADVETAVRGADAILVLTEWEQYGNLDWVKIAGLAADSALIFDGRNILDHERVRSAGLGTFVVGDGSRPLR